MANEFQLLGAESAVTIYAVLRNASGQPYNTATPGFETYNASNYTSYDIAMTEQGATGDYFGNAPTGLSSAQYSIDYRKQAGASPAVSDLPVGGETYRTLST
jgi:hypothetical protein